MTTISNKTLHEVFYFALPYARQPDLKTTAEKQIPLPNSVRADASRNPQPKALREIVTGGQIEPKLRPHPHQGPVDARCMIEGRRCIDKKCPVNPLKEQRQGRVPPVVPQQRKAILRLRRHIMPASNHRRPKPSDHMRRRAHLLAKRLPKVLLRHATDAVARLAVEATLRCRTTQA